MLVASDGLECSIAGLEIYALANMQISRLQAVTYLVCNVCKTWKWYGLGRVQRTRHQTKTREDLLTALD